MKITGGRMKGQTIHCPPGTIRPAMSRMRESVFSSIGPLDGLRFLDLFSGSGTMALEAYSRGAAFVHAVEKDYRKKPVIRKNLALAGDAARLSLTPVERFILKHQESFDVLFLDPPFPYRHRGDLLEKLCQSALVHSGSLVLLHFPGEDTPPSSLGSAQTRWMLEKYKESVFGRSLVNFYQIGNEPDAG